MVEDIRPILYLMWGGALFVLLIGCVNVANLVLVRSACAPERTRHASALGAGVSRVARQLIVEHVLLTRRSAVAGMMLASDFAALRGMHAINLQDLPRAHEIRLDGVVVALHHAITAAVIGLVLGLIPAMASMSTQVLGVLREEVALRQSVAARNRCDALVVAQVGSRSCC